MAAEWFYQVMREVIGPLTASELRRDAQEGKITADTFVRKGEEGRWVLANRVKGLFERQDGPYPKSGLEPTHPQPDHCRRCKRTDKLISHNRRLWCGWCGDWANPSENRYSAPRAQPARKQSDTASASSSLSARLIAAGIGIAAVTLLIAIILTSQGSNSKSSGNYNMSNQPDKSNTGYMGQTPDQAAKEVLDKITATPEGRAAVNRLASKDDQLSEFQRAHGISDRIAEAAIKEWVTTHHGNFDWHLEDVKAICLRNLRSGIPPQYLPESEKRR